MLIQLPKTLILISAEIDHPAALETAIIEQSGLNLTAHWQLPLSASQPIDPDNTLFLFAGDLSQAPEIASLAQQIPTLYVELPDSFPILSANDYLQNHFVGCIGLAQASHLPTVITQSLLNFQAQQQLKQALKEAQSRLEDRKQIERAKGLLMAKHHYDESEAYVYLRKLSMDRAQRMGEVAKQILSDTATASK